MNSENFLEIQRTERADRVFNAILVRYNSEEKLRHFIDRLLKKVGDPRGVKDLPDQSHEGLKDFIYGILAIGEAAGFDIDKFSNI